MPLPDVPITTLPDETAASEEPSKIVPLQDYVTILSSIISLPQDALDIPENLIQSHILDADQVDANAAKKEVSNPVKAIDEKEQLMPCSIKLRRISQLDVLKWQKQKLPDETKSYTRSVNNNYNKLQTTADHQ